jgi:molybdopterin/thiamine biosynthesis adenylyltransferase
VPKKKSIHSEHILAMATRYAVKRVFLATDDTETVSNITAYCAQHGIQVREKTLFIRLKGQVQNQVGDKKK